VLLQAIDISQLSSRPIESRRFAMLIKKLIQTRSADAELPAEVRAGLVDSLFAPITSLIAGAVGCSIIGACVAMRASDGRIMAVSVALLLIGLMRVGSAVLYKRTRATGLPNATRIWERIYEFGAWVFATLLGLLCWMTMMQTDDASLHLAVSTTTAGYAAAISGRNAGRPFIAIGQLTLCTLPLSIALLIYPEWLHKVQGVVVLLFIYGMMDITLGIRDVIVQALTMTRKEAALAARFEEQANRFDIALNNMSHGLCMMDDHDRLQVWNDRFLELLRLKNAPIRVGMTIPELVRHSIRAGNHKARSVKTVFLNLAGPLACGSHVEVTLDGERIMALSRRVINGGGSVIIIEDVTERKRAQDKIERLARYDDLTGLANRAQFIEQIEPVLAAVRIDDLQIAIHMIDLDRFKEINDTLGHPIGDKLLKEVAKRLSKVIGPADMITRFGGDEFVVLQTGARQRDTAAAVARKLAAALHEPFDIDGHRLDAGASIGISMAPTDGTDVSELLKKADMALYAAKSNGGGQHHFFESEMENAAQERRALELDLREAIAAGAFDLHFQPILDLRSGQVTCCEALVRWTHAVRGPVPPSVFIPVTEETGLIIPLGEWVLHKACAEAATWPSGIRVAVNLSAVQFRDRNLAMQVALALAQSGLRPQQLELEITERVLLDEGGETLTVMQQFQALGVATSLDDFGTGYSSLNYLRKFPFDKIKVDQSFTRDLSSQPEAKAIVKTIASLGAALDKKVVAEGIETKEEMELVAALGCHEGQGYYFSRPVNADAIRSYLRASLAKKRRVA
jgi:diguanylate cyclase (GGDEF)-like protein